MKKLLLAIITLAIITLAIITLGYTSHEEISNYLFGGKSCMPNELKQMR